MSGTGVVVPTTSSCGTSSDGTVVGTPNPLYGTIVTPQFTGTLPPGNYYVEYTFYTATGTETLPSPEIPVQLTSTGELTVAAPSSGLPANATGMRVYIASTSGAETLQGSSTGASSYIQPVPLVTGVAPPTTNTTICQQVANDAVYPTGTGYNVSLIDPAGNTLPGYPMLWQLLGAGSTLNLSNGLPYYHGIVTFPSPILSSPLNHATQGISGPVNLLGYNLTGVNSLTACVVNTTVYANCLPGVDIEAKVTAALALCASQCTIEIAAGGYNFATPIVLPLNIFGTYKLQGSPGAVLNYTGTGDAIVTPIGVNGPGDSNLIIEGFQINGNASATSGIHTYPTNRITIRNMTIQGFSSGDGIRVEGTNSSNIYDNLITNNFNGIHLIPTICNASYPYTCSSTGSGPNIFTPNAIHIFANQIVVNSNWCIWNDRNSNPGGLTGSLNNTYRDNDLEHCGTSPNGGSIYDTHSHGTVIDGNYFEASPHNVVLGEPGAGSALNTAGADVINNYFTTSPPISPATKQYNIELQNVINTSITGNSELITAGTGGNNCDINAITGGESGTYYGKNNFAQTSPFGNLLCINGSAAVTFAGAGSYMQFNMNYLPKIVDQNAVMTTAASDTFSSPTVTAASACYAQAGQNGTNPTASANAQAIIASVYVLAANGSFTVYHPTTTASGFIYNIFCTNTLN